jgi:hypothetical protein
VVPHLVDEGLSILQYADDTILLTTLFMDHDLDKANNLKLIFSAFEELSGIKINFHKSELFCFGEAQTMPTYMSSFLDVASGVFQLAIWAFRFIIGG